MKSEKDEKTEKQTFRLFQSEHGALKFVTNKNEGWLLADFSKNFRGCGRGAPANWGKWAAAMRKSGQMTGEFRTIQDYSDRAGKWGRTPDSGHPFDFGMSNINRQHR
jgi:hypothetical protein